MHIGPSIYIRLSINLSKTCPNIFRIPIVDVLYRFWLVGRWSRETTFFITPLVQSSLVRVEEDRIPHTRRSRKLLFDVIR